VARRAERTAPKETIIAADLAIEGKIEGAGHVRIAGRFKGDVHVDGNLTVEQGAHLTGQVYAKTVVIAGELHGNINGAARVELLESGLLAGDVKAGTLIVASGSRIRGHAECGWEEKSIKSVATG
jgi:cytoskeletal protein CcmA (bactofilin family)